MFNSQEFDSFETQTAGIGGGGAGGDHVPTIQELLAQTKQDAVRAKSYMQLIVIVIAMLLVMVYSALSEQNSNTDARQVNLGFTAADTLEEFLEANGGHTIEFDFERIFVEYQQIQFDNTYSSLSRQFISEFNRIIFGAQLDGSFLNTEDLKLLATCSESHIQLRDRIQTSIQTLANELISIQELQEKVFSSKVDLAKSYLQYRLSDLLPLQKEPLIPSETSNPDAQLEGNTDDTNNLDLLESNESTNQLADDADDAAATATVDNNLSSHNDLQEGQSEQEIDSLVKDSTDVHGFNSITSRNETDSIIETTNELMDCLGDESNLGDQMNVELIMNYVRFSKEKLEKITSEDFSSLDDKFILREILFIDENLMVLNEKVCDSHSRLHNKYQQLLFENFAMKSQTNYTNGTCRGINRYEKYIFEDFEQRQELLELRVNLNENVWKTQEAQVSLKEKYEQEVNLQLQHLVESYFKCIRLD